MEKLLVLLVLCLLLVGSVYYVNVSNNEDGEDEHMEEYQGPVPQDYDLEHFRKTGETIKEAEK